MRVVLCITAYNCENQISRVLKYFTDNPVLNKSIEKAYIINNRSTDKTEINALNAISNFSLKDKFSVIRNDENWGLGGSHKVAFELAALNNAEYLAILHGDDQANPAELLKLIEQAEQSGGVSNILGSRFSIGSRLTGYQPLRIFGNIVLNIIYTIMMGRLTYDLGSGLNLFRVVDFNNSILRKFSDKFTFNMDLLLYLYQIRANIIFYPITWTETDQISNAKNFSVAWSAFKQLLKWRFQPKWYNHQEVAKNYSFKVLN